MESIGLTLFDVIGIVFIFSFLIYGFIRGFLKEVSGLLSWIISLVCAKMLSFTVGEKLYAVFNIHDKIVAEINSIVDKADFSTLDNLRNSLNKGIENLSFVGKFIGDFVKTKWDITSIYQSGAVDVKSKIVDTLVVSVEPTVKYVMELLAFIILFIILIILTSVILKVLTRVFEKIPLVGTVNNLLGAVAGTIKGIILFVILFATSFVVLSLTGSEWIGVLKESRFFELIIGLRYVLPSG